MTSRFRPTPFTSLVLAAAAVLAAPHVGAKPGSQKVVLEEEASTEAPPSSESGEASTESGAETTRADTGSSSESAPMPKKVVLGKIGGAKSQTIRKAIVETIKKDGSLEFSAEGEGSSLELESEDNQISDAAKAAQARAILVGNVSPKGWVLSLQVRNGKDGALLEELTLKGGTLPGLQKKIKESLMETLAGPLGNAEGHKPEVQLEEAPAEEPKEEPPPSEPEEAKEGRPSALDLMIGMRGYNRDLAYNDTLPQLFPDNYTKNVDEPLPYGLPLGPMALIHVNWYPIAHFAGGPAANIGLMGRYEIGFLTSSSLDGEKISTSSTSWNIGLRYRIPFGDSKAKDRSHIAPLVNYGTHQYKVDDENVTNNDGDPGPFIPDLGYSFIEAGLDSRFVFGKFALGVHGQYRIVTALGGIKSAEWFADATGSGIFAGASLGYNLTSILEVSGGVDFLQYGLAFNMKPPPPARNDRIAGGATDRYISGWLGFGIRLPFIPGEAAPEPEPSKPADDE